MDENENEIERRIQILEDQFYRFIIWMEVLGGSVAPFLTMGDILNDDLSKEFSRDIDLTPFQPPLRCNITLRLMSRKEEYVQDAVLTSVGMAPWFSILEYRQIEDDVVTCITLQKQSFTIDYRHVALRQCLRKLSWASLDRIIVTIPALMNIVRPFFDTKIQKVLQGKVDTVLFFNNVGDVYNLANKFKKWQKIAVMNQKGVQEFQCLVFEATQALLSTKGFVKSKNLKNIREMLEKRSKEILVK